jgi:hypothetical protein
MPHWQGIYENIIGDIRNASENEFILEMQTKQKIPTAQNTSNDVFWSLFPSPVARRSSVDLSCCGCVIHGSHCDVKKK